MQIGRFLRKTTNGYTHWCPACGEMHIIFDDGWTFNGDIEHPTFQPSVRITGTQKIIVDGKWTGEWATGPGGEPKPYCCHYILALGILRYCGDCTHGYAGQNVQLPELPPGYRDQV
jgi:hypothetical protein